MQVCHLNTNSILYVVMFLMISNRRLWEMALGGHTGWTTHQGGSGPMTRLALAGQWSASRSSTPGGDDPQQSLGANSNSLLQRKHVNS